MIFGLLFLFWSRLYRDRLPQKRNKKRPRQKITSPDIASLIGTGLYFRLVPLLSIVLLLWRTLIPWCCAFLGESFRLDNLSTHYRQIPWFRICITVVKSIGFLMLYSFRLIKMEGLPLKLCVNKEDAILATQ